MGAGAAASFDGPVFLVGMPRSGTKMLRGLLNNHPRVGIPPVESELLPDWARRWEGFGDLSQIAHFRAFAQQIRGSSYFVYMREEQGHEIDVDAWFAAIRSFDPAGVFEAMIRLDAEVPEGSDRIWGDKSPGYLAHLDLIDSLFPTARFIHLVRDVRDYCLSMHKAWGKSRLRAAQRWVDRVSEARRFGAQTAGPGRYMELRYEDLLDRTESELRRVAAFLDLPFDPAMARLSRPTEDRGDTRGKVGVQRDNKEKWRTEMSAPMRRAIEEIAGPLLAELAYPTDHVGPARRLPLPAMRLLQLADGVGLIRTDARRWGWVGALRFRSRMFKEYGKVDGAGRP